MNRRHIELTIRSHDTTHAEIAALAAFLSSIAIGPERDQAIGRMMIGNIEISLGSWELDEQGRRVSPP